MKIEIFDRHAENVNEGVPLCEHPGLQDFRPGDNMVLKATMEMPGWLPTSKTVVAEAEFEIHFITDDHIMIIINHADYIAAKRAMA